MKVSRVDAPRCEGGENPLWDSRTNTLLYVDNTGMKIHRHDPAAGTSQTWDMPNVITTLALRKKGGAVVTLRSGIHFFDFDTGALDVLHPLPDPPPYVYNDGRIDAQGRFLIGASTANFDDPQPDGGLYRLDPDHSLHKLDTGIHFSNSNSFSPDGRTLYFSDSWVKTTYAYDYDPETGEIANRRVFVNTGELGGLPDGTAVDADGRVWMVIYGGAKIAAFRPDGSLERTIDMPVPFVTSVAFGGPDLDRLFVTTSAHDILGGEVGKDAGTLYVIDGLGTRGQPENLYSG